MRATDARLICLHPDDNVLVVRQRISAGERIDVEAGPVAAAVALPLGHKVAARAIRVGETILKYGAPIGVATADIAAGMHVHVHNMRSNYTPTYHLESLQAQEGEGS